MDCNKIIQEYEVSAAFAAQDFGIKIVEPLRILHANGWELAPDSEYCFVEPHENNGFRSIMRRSDLILPEVTAHPPDGPILQSGRAPQNQNADLERAMLDHLAEMYLVIGQAAQASAEGDNTSGIRRFFHRQFAYHARFAMTYAWTAHRAKLAHCSATGYSPTEARLLRDRLSLLRASGVFGAAGYCIRFGILHVANLLTRDGQTHAIA